MSQLRICFFGNTNNYPLLLCEGFRALGHQVTLIVNRTELLHRPEARYPDWTDQWPAWIVDCSSLREDDIVCDTPALDDLVHLMSHGVDLAILNDTGPALAGHLTCPHVALLTGSDLSYYGSFEMIEMRTASWSPQFRRSSQGRRSIERMTRLVARQRDGIASADLVCFGLPGLIPTADRLLEVMGVTSAEREMLLLANVDAWDAKPSRRRSGPLQILSGSRIVYRRDANSALGPQDLKGSDVLIEGFARYCQRGGTGSLRLPQKGQDLSAAKSLIERHQIADRVSWMPECDLAGFHEEIRNADVVCDQFGSSFPGMVTADAFALGRPVLANLRPDVFATSRFGALPGLHAENAEQIANHLMGMDRDRSIIARLGADCRRFAEQLLAPKVAAHRLLSCLGLAPSAPPEAMIPSPDF